MKIISLIILGLLIITFNSKLEDRKAKRKYDIHSFLDEFEGYIKAKDITVEVSGMLDKDQAMCDSSGIIYTGTEPTEKHLRKAFTNCLLYLWQYDYSFEAVLRTLKEKW